MAKTDDEAPSRRFEDEFNHERCHEAQRLALAFVPALRKLPGVIEKQNRSESDFEELRDSVDKKLDKIIDSVDVFSKNMAVMAERAEAQARDFIRIETEIKSLWIKLMDLEKDQHETQIKVATNTVSQNNTVAIAKNVLPYIAMLIATSGTLYAIFNGG